MTQKGYLSYSDYKITISSLGQSFGYMISDVVQLGGSGEFEGVYFVEVGLPGTKQ